jgi:diaminopimelate decarboxylase
MYKLQFLEQNQIEQIQKKYKTPVYVYSEKELITSAEAFLNFPSAF